MGAEPIALLVNLSLPETNATQTAAGVYEGILATAAAHQMAIAGGDITVYRGPLAISITIVGRVPTGAGWLRSGAEVGDTILVTGAFGGSILGRHLKVEPRVAAARTLRDQLSIHAAIDVSDGLSLDLDRLCAASGVGAELDLQAIPIHPDAHRLAAERQTDPLHHALGDGEDFELIFTVPPDQRTRLAELDCGVAITPIGTCTARTGIWSLDSGRHVRLSPSGYVHGEH
jgi:thiamine-monophosphate kinase